MAHCLRAFHNTAVPSLTQRRRRWPGLLCSRGELRVTGYHPARTHEPPLIVLSAVQPTELEYRRTATRCTARRDTTISSTRPAATNWRAGVTATHYPDIPVTRGLHQIAAQVGDVTMNTRTGWPGITSGRPVSNPGRLRDTSSGRDGWRRATIVAEPITAPIVFSERPVSEGPSARSTG